jgi:beta-lysine 5,6-aminomutase alpha subunit
VSIGPTTEGYGGTFATQANFKIMREAIDEWSELHKRYVRLSSFCSGLCMSEIAVMGAWEGFDNMVNDALYGILYRDINVVRGLIDQRVSRLINGWFGVTINTGEDNYLRTADAIEAAHTVTASQFINHQLARDSGVPDEQIALGDAFEIDVPVRNGLLYEWAQAQLTRELFPDCPVKYMPPTRHMDGNLFRTHAADTLFNLVTIATGQGIQTIGVPTEGIFTPHIHDRVLGLQNVDYVFNAAHDLGEEIEFKEGGIIQTRAQEVLAGARELLEQIAHTGLIKAIAEATFGDVSRTAGEGRGIEGIVEIEEGYFNPVEELMCEAPAYA